MWLPIAGMGLGIYTVRQCACARQELNNKRTIIFCGQECPVKYRNLSEIKILFMIIPGIFMVIPDQDKELDVASCQRPHVNIPVHWRCKYTTFLRGVVRFWPFQSLNSLIWPNKSVYVHQQLQVNAILLRHIPHRHRRQQFVARSDTELLEFLSMAQEPSL